MRATLLGLLLLVTACGPTRVAAHSTPSASAAVASASPSLSPPVVATPSPWTPSAGVAPASPSTIPSRHATSGQRLLAVLEAKTGANPYQWSTVALAGLDGYARAKAVYTPMPIPYAGCSNILVPLPAHVVAGKVYFSDGTGAIYSLSPRGQLAWVTQLPLKSSQQLMSFAVSPDGTRVLGSIVSLPPPPSADPCAGGGASGPEFGAGDFSYDIYGASSGGSARLLHHEDRGPTTLPAAQVVFVTGWDARGPLGTRPDVNVQFGSGWSSPGGAANHYWGLPVRLDPNSGQVVGEVSDPSCIVSDFAPSGDFVCSPAGAEPSACAAPTTPASGASRRRPGRLTQSASCLQRRIV